MHLTVNPPILPMLANRVDELPAGEGWIFEPKWDGFRTLIFRDGDELLIQSRDEKPLDRYFPELIEPIKTQLPERCVLDGEIVIALGDALDFEALQLRLHPAASRVKKLAGEMPASIVFFDVLCESDRDLRATPFATRRAALESILAGSAAPLHLTPATRDRHTAADWFRRFEGAGLDGVMAKPETGIYQPNKRVMLKVKHERECDCVVAGFRWHKNAHGTAIGSLLLGLFDDAANLDARGRKRSRTRRRRTGVRGCRAAGARARTCPGSRFGPSSSPRWRTTTCKEAAFGTRRSSAAGVATSVRVTARMRSSRSCHRTSWHRSSRLVRSRRRRALSSLAPTSRAIPASDHHRGQAFPAPAETRPAHDGG